MSEDGNRKEVLLQLARTLMGLVELRAKLDVYEMGSFAKCDSNIC